MANLVCKNSTRYETHEKPTSLWYSLLFNMELKNHESLGQCIKLIILSTLLIIFLKFVYRDRNLQNCVQLGLEAQKV